MVQGYCVDAIRGKVPTSFLSTLEYATNRYKIAQQNLQQESAEKSQREAAKIIQEANDAYMVWKKANQLIAEYLGEKINGKG